MAEPVVTKLLVHPMPDLAPPALHAEVRAAVERPAWSFGNQSVTEEGGLPFWKMLLDDCEPVTRLWEHARPRCEARVGRPLEVLRQYANGHTYGQGGRTHVDDTREGTYTLLYYPMDAWRPEWEGETVFVEPVRGDILASVKPRPNAALLFDARIPHHGRAPGRAFGGLRVTIAFKLQVAD